MSFDVETLGAILACNGGYSGNLSASKIVNTVSGSPAVIEDASNLPLEGIDFYGETKLVPTPGKNLLKNTADSLVQNGINFTVNSDGSIVANGTNTSLVDVAYIEINRTVALKKGSYLVSTGNSNASRSTFGIYIWNVNDYSEVYYVYDSDVQIDVTEETTTYRVLYFVALGATTSNETVYPMIREVSITDSTYEPYLGDVTIPSPDHPLLIERTVINQVKVTGKNLFAFEKTAIDVTSELRALVDQRLIFTKIDDNSIKCNYTGGNYGTGYVEINGVDGTKDYSFSFVNKENSLGYTPRIEKDIDKSTSTKLVLIIYSGCGNNIISSDNYFVLSNIQVELGTTVTPYEPFQCQTIDLPEPIELNGIGDVKDTIRLRTDGSGKLIQKVYKKVLTGNESFHTYTPDVGGIQFGCKDENIMQIESENVLCTHLPSKFTWNVCEDGIAVTNTSSVVVRFRLESLGIYTTADLKAKLKEWYNAGNPITLYAPLKTPVETAITQPNINAIKSAHTYKPNTVITNNAGALMDVHYVVDRKSYIDKKFEALANAVLNQ